MMKVINPVYFFIDIMDRFETKEFLRLIQLTHPKFKIDKEIMGMWYACFFEKPFDKMKLALKAHVKRCKFVPAIAEIETILAELEPPPEWARPRIAPEIAERNSKKEWQYRKVMQAKGSLMLKEVVNGHPVYRYIKYKEDGPLWVKGGEDVRDGESIPYLIAVQ